MATIDNKQIHKPNKEIITLLDYLVREIIKYFSLEF